MAVESCRRARIMGALVGAATVVSLSLGGGALAQDVTPAPYEPSENVDALSGRIVGDGSSTVGPITEAVAEEFRLGVTEGVQVELNISGTGGGFERFCNGETDLQNASRAIREEEIASCAANGVEYYEFEVAYDGLAILVNPAADWLDCITTDQLKQIWANGSTVTNWSDVNPEWPEKPINLYGPGTDSGTYDYFVDEIIGDAGSRTDYTPSEDDNVLVEGVAGDQNALAFFGLAYYEQNADRLKLLGVDNRAGCVEPSAETVQSLEYAPLSRPLYVYVTAEALTRPEVQEFMRFYIAEAPALAEDVGYVDSPMEVYVADQTKLEAAIAGTGTPDGPSGSEGASTPAAG